MLCSAALAATSVLHGCMTEVSTLGVSCERNTQCDAPLVCRLGRCRQECASARDCAIGSICVRDAQGVGACRLPDEALCARPSDCAAPLVCRAGACTNECASDRDCAPGSLCDGEAGCVDLAEHACVLDSECAPLVCARDGRCRDECLSDRDCRAGSACRDGSCERLVPDAGAPRDAGSDAPADGGTDAPEDAGLDGGEDAEVPVDAGVDGGVDAGPRGPPCPGGIADCGSVPNANLACRSGFCEIAACRGGYDDCDRLFETGCETLPPTDVDHCGACGNACGAGEVCVGRCETGRIEEIASGHWVTCVRFSTGHVACWGANSLGQTGDGSAPFTNTVRPSPILVVGLSDATQIGIGVSQAFGQTESHACALRASGQVVCWGANRFGQTGSPATTLGQATPAAVPGLSDAVEIAVGDAFSCARRADGTVVCWGSQASGRLGNGSTAEASISTPVSVSTLSGVVSLVGSHDAFACAEVGASEPRCWGTGGFESLALGAGRLEAPAATPVAATQLTGLGLTGLRGASGVTYGIDGEGRVRCWGSSFDARCGPHGTSSETPRVFETPVDVVEVQGGRGASWLRTSDGAVYCWGPNTLSQCGLGNADSPLEVPTRLPDFADVRLVSAGTANSCVVRESGGVWCTGANGQGQLGRDTTGAVATTFGRVGGLP